MDRLRMEYLLQFITAGELARGYPGRGGKHHNLSRASGMFPRWHELLEFGAAYCDWFIARGEGLPSDVGRPATGERWMRAYHELELKGRHCRAVAEAASWNKDGSAGESVRPLLLAEEGTVDAVASALGLDRDSVEAYEQLYYNVRDRLSEKSWVTRIVYPRGRMEEIQRFYFETADMETLAARAAYNNGMADALWFLGHHGQLPSGAEAAKGARDEVAATGWIVSRNGGALRGDVQSVKAALDMYKTETMAGGTGVTDEDGPGSVPDAVMNLMEETARLNNMRQRQLRLGQTVDVGMSALPDPGSQSNKPPDKELAENKNK